jgi:hypothetical protein
MKFVHRRACRIAVPLGKAFRALLLKPLNKKLFFYRSFAQSHILSCADSAFRFHKSAHHRIIALGLRLTSFISKRSEMHRLKIVVTRSATLLGLAAIFYLSSPLSTPTTTGVAFKQTEKELNAEGGLNNMPRSAIEHSLSFPGSAVPMKNSLEMSTAPLSDSTEVNMSPQGGGIQLVSATTFYRPALPREPAFQAELTHPSLIMPNIRGSEGVGIFFLFWTALSMLYLAKRR